MNSLQGNELHGSDLKPEILEKWLNTSTQSIFCMYNARHTEHLLPNCRYINTCHSGKAGVFIKIHIIKLKQTKL